MLKKLVTVLLLGFFLTACAANQAAFLSEPAGANVYVDGELVGTTPCQLEYHNGSGDDFEVVIEKAGFEPVVHSFKADEVDHAARQTWLAAGLIWSPLWIGTLFTKKLKSCYEIVLKPADSDLTAQAEVAGSSRPTL